MTLPIMALLLLAQATQKPSAQKAADAMPVHDVQVGGTAIKVPTPFEFERADGRDAQRDAVLNASLPNTHRCVIRFEPISGDSLPSGRGMNIQVLRSLENQEIGERTFREFKAKSKAELDKLKPSLNQQMQTVVSDAGKRVSGTTGLETKLQISDTEILGHFGDTPASLGFTLSMRRNGQLGEAKVADKIVTSAMILPINGRLLFLYAMADYGSEDARHWTETAVTQWRDKVWALNPRIEGPHASKSFSEGGLRAAIIGAVVGLLGAGIGIGGKKSKR